MALWCLPGAGNAPHSLSLRPWGLGDRMVGIPGWFVPTGWCWRNVCLCDLSLCLCAYVLQSSLLSTRDHRCADERMGALWASLGVSSESGVQARVRIYRCMRCCMTASISPHLTLGLPDSKTDTVPTLSWLLPQLAIWPESCGFSSLWGAAS